jgi:ATP-dependent DNA helicase
MDCKLIKELLTYNSANRLLITGTPLQNNIAELWSLLHFLLPEVFNDLGSFESWFDFSSVLDTKGQQAVVQKRKRNLVSTIHAILKPFLLRRVKTDVETSLPKKREYILYAPLTCEQKELYREILAGSSRQYLEDKAVERIDARNLKTLANTLKRKAGADSEASTPNKSTRTSRSSTPGSASGSTRKRRGRPTYVDITDREFNLKLQGLKSGFDEPQSASMSSDEEEEIERAKTIKLAKKEISAKKLQNPLMQARLCCNSPHNFYWPFQPGEPPDSTLITASGKLLLLDRLVPALFAKGHKILLFSQFKTTLDILQDWASELRSYKCCRIDGSISQVDRQAQIKAFNSDPSFKLFLLSTRAGGQGINLTAADTVILFDSDWNPQQDLQAQDRAHRIGQTKPVIVYRLATKGTVEQTLLEKADSKRRLEKLVIQKGKFRSLTLETKTAEDADEIKKILAEDDWEKYDLEGEGDEIGNTADGVGERKVREILSERDLAILTDRSEEAYVKAAKGIDTEGNVFKAVETKPEGDGLLESLEVS